MVSATDGLVDRDLRALAEAHRRATEWGAARFAAEFRRRAEEEHALRIAEARALTGTTGPDATGTTVAPRGPVDARVEDRAIGDDRGGVDLHKPVRHAHVPRPLTAEVEAAPRRWFKRRSEPAEREHARPVSADEAARMSPAARRLYGIEDAPGR